MRWSFVAIWGAVLFALITPTMGSEHFTPQFDERTAKDQCEYVLHGEQEDMQECLNIMRASFHRIELHYLEETSDAEMLAAFNKCRIDNESYWLMVETCVDGALVDRELIPYSMAGQPNELKSEIVRICRSKHRDDFLNIRLCAELCDAHLWDTSNRERQC